MIDSEITHSEGQSFNLRLFFKVTLIVGFIIVSAVAILNFFFLHKIAESNVKQIKGIANTTSIVVSELAIKSFYGRDQEIISKALDRAIYESGELDSGLLKISVILLPSGIYYASTTKEFKNKKVGKSLLKKLKSNTRSGTASEILNYEVNKRSLPVIQFLRNIVIDDDGEAKKVAITQILFDYNRILNKTREYLFMVGFVVLICSLLLVWLLFLPLSRANKKLIDAFNQISRHNFAFTLKGGQGEIGLMYNAFNKMAASLKKGFQDKIIENSKQVGDNIQSVPKEQSIRKTEITCLCARIPRIQQRIEVDTPEQINDYLSEFVAPLEVAVQEYGGQIVKVLGNKVFAFFEGINSIDNSIRTALKINQQWQVINRERKVLNRELADFGVGLHSTEGVAGIFSGIQNSYTIIGRASSVAEFLCSCAKKEEILVTSVMMDKTSGSFQHQISTKLTIYNSPAAKDVLAITPLPFDDESMGGVNQKSNGDNSGSGFQDGSNELTSAKMHLSKPSFDSSITDMLEETLVSAPLEPLVEETMEDDPFAEDGDQSTGQSSLWDEFDTNSDNKE